MNLVGLKNELVSELKSLLFSNFQIDFNVTFEKSIKREFGDFSTSFALKLASQIGKKPMELANQIVELLSSRAEIADVTVTEPGFVNFVLSDRYVVDLLSNDDGFEPKSKGKVIVEYSSPNIAKPLGAHHLLSTIIGQSVSNIMRYVGWNVVSVNYPGDWGTQFGKLVVAYKKWGSREVIEQNPIQELLQLYVKFHEAVEVSPELDDEARAEFSKLEKGDLDNRKIWEWIVEVSKRDIEKVYNLLGGIHFDIYEAESHREKDLEPLLVDGKSKGIITEGEKGAFIIDLTPDGLQPFLVQKKDGATLYSTRDICTIKYRLETYDPIKIIYVVDSAQSLHFKQLFAAVTRFKWFRPVELKHLKFGRMLGMSTRKGNIVYLEDLIAEAISRASDIIEKKNPLLKNKAEVARIVGTGAMKYSILMQSPETDIVFDWDKILSFDGNSAPYLQYGYVRAKSILDDFKGEIGDISDDYLLNEHESVLCRQVLDFDAVVMDSVEKYKPNLIANYLFELVCSFNVFYAHCPVLTLSDDVQKNARLKIIQLFAEKLKTGLRLLGGIEVPDEM